MISKLLILKMFTGKKSECEKYSLTTTAEFSSSEEEEVVPRQRKKKKYDDYVTGIYSSNGILFFL